MYIFTLITYLVTAQGPTPVAEIYHPWKFQTYEECMEFRSEGWTNRTVEGFKVDAQCRQESLNL